MFGRTDGRTETFRTAVGRTDGGRTDGQKIFGRTETFWTAGRPNGRTDGRKNKKTKNAKCVSNDRSRRDDSESGRIVKIGAILGYFWPLQSLQKKSQLPKEPTMSKVH